MKLTHYPSRNHEPDKYVLEISVQDHMNARLDPFDLLLLRDCEGSNKISDKLLALETLTRRIEQSNRQPKEAKDAQ